jgi:hypothetical protein
MHRALHFLPATALAAVVLAAHGAAAQQTAMPLTLFNASYSAATGSGCMDGTPYGYYLTPGAQADSWVIFLEGGGACWDQASCVSRLNTSLGSSDYWASTYTDTNNLLSTDEGVNPVFSNWTHVYLAYCSSDVYSGQRTAQLNASWPFLFAGHNNVAAVVADLRASHGLSSAARVLLSGSSAGGIGAFIHADWLADALGPAVDVRATPQGGFFFPNVVPYVLFALNITDGPYPWQLLPTYEVWDSYTSPACVAAHNESFCSSINNAYPFIRTRLYVVENVADSNQIYTQLGCPSDGSAGEKAYIAYFGQRMREAIGATVLANATKGDGLFLPACVAHTEDTYVSDPLTITGVAQGSSLLGWYFASPGVPTQLQDGCTGPLPCDPQCPPAPPLAFAAAAAAASTSTVAGSVTAEHVTTAVATAAARRL